MKLYSHLVCRRCESGESDSPGPHEHSEGPEKCCWCGREQQLPKMGRAFVKFGIMAVKR